MHKNTKKILLHYILAPIALVIMLLLIYRQIEARGNIAAQWTQIKSQLNADKIVWFVFVVFLAPVNWTLEAMKWHKLLSRIRPVPFAKAFKSMLLGMSFSLITPNRVGDFAGRIIHIEQGYKVKAAVASVIGSIAKMLVTAVFGIFGLIYFNLHFGNSYTQTALVFALLLASSFILLYLNINRFGGFSKQHKWLRKLNFGLRVLRFYSRRDLGYILLLAVIRFAVFNAQFLIIVNIFGAAVPVFPGILLSSLMYWAISMVPSVAMLDLGVRGFVGLYLFVETGISSEPLAIIGGSYVLWCINMVLPAIFGSFTLLSIDDRNRR